MVETVAKTARMAGPKNPAGFQPLDKLPEAFFD